MLSPSHRRHQPVTCSRDSGFTLIEIAIVLVIIGLLLGGVLKGQELITSARVRNLISTQDGVKAAYFGFLDRFRALPGDYTLATTNITGATGNGNGNGRIESAGAVVNSSKPEEDILVWEHLSRSGFINGTYTWAATASATTSPTNPYGVYMQVIYDGIYGSGNFGADGATASPSRHNIKTGSQVPVEIIVEVDRKVDDGLPNTGGFQFSRYQGNGAAAPTDAATATPACTVGNGATAANNVWNATNGSTNCGGASLL
jgi:prepilin-type N-terminal cleavage/methylation domain-containing protein